MRIKTLLASLTLAATSLVAGAESNGNPPLTLVFTGDIMMGTTYPTVRLPMNDGRNLFTDVAPLLSKADIAAGNLEGAMCEGGKPRKKESSLTYAFRMPTRYGALLKRAGFDFMSLANNHSLDFGSAGAEQTIVTLRNNGIKPAGIRGLCETAIIEKGGIKYGFCAFGHNHYTPSISNTDKVRQLLSGLRDKVDVLIVSFHGGAEGKDFGRVPQGKEMFHGENRGDVRKFAHLCVDEGADVVYGHGPHVVRALELYKGRLIAYSLGNFCTPCGISVAGTGGHAPVLEVRVSRKGRFLDGRIHSFLQRYGTGPKRDGKHTAALQIRRLTQADFPHTPLNIKPDGAIFRK